MISENKKLGRGLGALLSSNKNEKNNQIINEDLFDQLWSGVVKSFIYDLKNHKISIDVDVLENTVHTCYKISFMALWDFKCSMMACQYHGTILI